FVMGGVTMFWFIRKLHKKYWVAIIGGALFTFSTYHFAHATGHLQLVSLEWIPLFLLAFWTLLEKFRWRDAFFASGALFLVLLCDYYYLFWSVMLGGMWLLWKLYKKEVPFTKKNMLVFGLFVALALLLVGPLIFALWNLTKTDVLLGFHDPVVFSMDPLTIFIPGGSWYWWHLTEFYSSKLPYFSEMSIFFGFGLLSVLAVAGFKRVFKRAQFKMPPWLDFWWIVLIVFGLLALGPHLRIASHVLESVPLPYAFLEMVFPTLQISGMPVRWILIALIAAIVIVTYMLSRLDIRTKKAKYIVAAFVAVSIIDLYPRPIPLTTAQVGEYVHRLKQLPPGAVLDEAAESEPMQLRNQTVHEKPMPFGYVTRLPKSVDEKNAHIWAASQRGEYARLCNEFGIRYISQPTERPMPLLDDSLIIFRDSQAKLYDLQALSTSSGSLPCSKQ
ncbi:MAG TPA: hypothetical protein VFO38_02625, partial [Candidatus Saccharimonadales bacterium]|nr:hypothetical protein [Candidatus Saccharimonadales bacterium]